MIYAVIICAVASLSTALGGIIVVLIKNITDGMMSVFQGFAAAVMITVSFGEMLPHALKIMFMHTEHFCAAVALIVLFLFGWLAGMLISEGAEGLYRNDSKDTEVKKISIITTTVMVLHNLPEGMLTIFTGMSDAEFGLKMAAAVALHNIPEGVVVASSAVCAGNSKLKGLWHSFLAGFSEFTGGIVAALIFCGKVDDLFISAILCAVSGVMVQTSLCELIPSGLKLADKKYTVYGSVLGLMVIIAGILIF